MTGIRGKKWFFFIWDPDAEEVFFNPYVITPNKKKKKSYDPNEWDEK